METRIILFLLRQNRPLRPSEVAKHLSITTKSAGLILESLAEKRAIKTKHYSTNHRYYSVRDLPDDARTCRNYLLIQQIIETHKNGAWFYDSRQALRWMAEDKLLDTRINPITNKREYKVCSLLSET